MNPQMGQQAPGGQQPQAQFRTSPMYSPSHIRTLPTLAEEEKTKYEQGLQTLWNRFNACSPNTPEQLAAKQKIVEFSRMLVNKIQARRVQQAQQLQQQAAQQQNLQQQQQQTLQQAQQQMQQQQQQGQAAQQQQVQPRPQQVQQNATQAVAQQQQNVATTAAQANNAAAGGAPRPNAQNPQAQNPAQQRPPIPQHILTHVNKMSFRAPASYAEKAAEAAKWIEEMRERYARALMTMESSKQKVAQIDKLTNDRAAAGNPFKEEELRHLQIRKEQQLKVHQDAFKWVDSVRKSQGNLQGTNQAAQGATAAAQSTQQPTQVNAVQAQNQVQAQQNQQTQVQAQPQAHPQNNGQNTAQNMTQNAAAPVNAAMEAAKQQMVAAGRASPAAGPQAAAQQARQAQATPQPGQQPKVQTQPVIKQEPPHPPPVNTAIASGVAQPQPQQTGTPTQQAARVQTPQQTTTPATVGGPTRALSHSAAMSLANQRAASTPGSAPVPPGQQPNSGTPTPAPGAVNQGVMGPSMPQHQQPQGHPHAHPPQPQQQPSMQSKMPIPKQLPDRATTVPQGVAVGGGVNTGRPTMSQGSGTLGGVMNQPPINRVPAYNHEAEGDHVLSKKKLDELVRQVCGGTGEGDGNLLTPEVEENVLNMADSFVDNVLHAACRNSKERGSKVLEIRDLQLVLERAYNIRVPGYSSDELRTVRKVQPSPGWIAKMSAVQAAKVMPGKGE